DNEDSIHGRGHFLAIERWLSYCVDERFSIYEKGLKPNFIRAFREKLVFLEEKHAPRASKGWRELAGLTLLIAGVILGPFAYWLSLRYFLVSAILCIVGLLLYATPRVLRRMEVVEKDAAGNSALDIPVGGAARGFPGHRAFDEPLDADDAGSD
ncbi:MAG TPA: hypothetical protein VF050_00585, partial [Moraxellaceae bacterium]